MNDQLKQTILEAIENNNLPAIDELSNDKIILTTPVKMNACLIHVAAEKGRIELIKIILKKHPDLLDQLDAANQSPLLWAASFGHLGLVHYLLLMKAELNTRSNIPGNPDDGKTALH